MEPEPPEPKGWHVWIAVLALVVAVGAVVLLFSGICLNVVAAGL